MRTLMMVAPRAKDQEHSPSSSIVTDGATTSNDIKRKNIETQFEQIAVVYTVEGEKLVQA